MNCQKLIVFCLRKMADAPGQPNKIIKNDRDQADPDFSTCAC
jgi:hypothetical protein